MPLPTNLYVQFDGSQLVVDTKPEDSLRHAFLSAGQWVAEYSLARQVTAKVGLPVVTELTDQVPIESLPKELFAQADRRGIVVLNRTAQGAAGRPGRSPQAPIGVYERARYLSVAAAVELTDIAPAAATATTTAATPGGAAAQA